MKGRKIVKKYEKEVGNIQNKINQLQKYLNDKKNKDILGGQNPAKLKAIHFKLTVSKMILDDTVDLLNDRVTQMDPLLKEIRMKPNPKQNLLPI